MTNSCCGCGSSGGSKRSMFSQRKSKRVTSKKKDAMRRKLKSSELEGTLDSLTTRFAAIRTPKSKKSKSKTRRATMGMSDMLDAIIEDVPFAQNPFRRTGMKSARRVSVKTRTKKRSSPRSKTRKRRYSHIMKLTNL